MAFVVCEPCIKCKFTDCVEVCPVAAFREGETMVAIDPDVCIDCAACVDECPSGAICSEYEVPEKWQEYIELNARYSKQWPVIQRTQAPLPTAGEYLNKPGKGSEFSPNPAPRDKAE